MSVEGTFRANGSTTLNSLSLNGFSSGSIPFIGSNGLIKQNNNNLFWDNTNNRLGIGTNSPAYNLDVTGTSKVGTLFIDPGATSSPYFATDYSSYPLLSFAARGVDNPVNSIKTIINIPAYNRFRGTGAGSAISLGAYPVRLEWFSDVANSYLSRFRIRTQNPSGTVNTGVTFWENGGVSIGQGNPATDNQDPTPPNGLSVAGNASFFSNLDLPTTTSTAGILNINGSRFLHSYGTGNTFVGINSGNFTTTGANNTAYGYQTLTNNTTGNNNIASGYQALTSNTTGNNNIASGYLSLTSNTTGNNNMASGSYSLFLNTTGGYNTVSGHLALYNNTTGSYNVGFGHQALYSNTTGTGNVGSGHQTFTYNTTENYSTGTGYQSLINNTTGSNNTSTGSFSLYANTTGIGNVGLGYNAGYLNTTGNHNTYIGYQAGYTGTTDGLTNTTAIGYNTQVTASNSLILGNGANVGIGNTAPGYKLDLTGTFNATGAVTLGSTLGVTGNTTLTTLSTSGLATLNSLSITGFTQGSILIIGTSGSVSQNNSQFFWDNTNNRLGIGTSTPNSKLQVLGAVATAYSNKTADYTLTENDSVITRDATSGAITITLPTAVGITGRQYTVNKSDASGNTISLTPNGAQTINGVASYSLTAQYKYVIVVSNGSNWFVVGNN